nr:MAG TPA: hypothetical protein [Caudoviricetes sp.]
MQTQPTTRRRPGKHEAALRLLPEGAQIADQIWNAPVTPAAATARKMALHAGSAAAALRDFGPHRNEVGDSAIRAALYDLQAMEEGRANPDLDYLISVAKGDALTAYLARKEIGERKAAEWRRELTVVKAAMFSAVAA